MKKITCLAVFISAFSFSISAQFGPQQIISTDADFANHVIASDLDGDGDMDVISASDIDNKIAWFENLGADNFSVEHLLTDLAGSVNEIYVIDVDNDTDFDVFAATDDYLIWFENNADGTFQPYVQISLGPSRISSVLVIDVDGDGLPDVIGSFINLDKVVWYKNNGDGTFGNENLITNLTNSPQSIFAIDIDNDGDQDVLSASLFDNKVAWYQNDGIGNFGTQQIIVSTSNSPRSVFSVDLDGDGDNDVLTAFTSDNKISWYQNNGLGSFGTEIIISINAFGAQSVSAADVNGDGNIDVLSASETDDKLAWYENDGLGNILSEQVISFAADGPQFISTADIDQDGDLDILSASREDDKIAWYKNLINDLDDDGVLNENDCAPNDPLLYEGASCDDGEPTTENDLIIFDCSCAGTLIDPLEHFVTTWKTDNPGTSNNTSVNIPIFLGETYNYDVDWNNDGIFDEFGFTGNATHDYEIEGVFTIRIKGIFPRINFSFSGDRLKIISIDQWGSSIEWTSMENAFSGCSNLAGQATDKPNLSGVQNLTRMFNSASLFNQDIGNWDVSTITNTGFMFQNAFSFDQDIGNWNVSNVQFMDYMFANAAVFNRDIGNWNMINVEVTYAMFLNAAAFDKDIGGWVLPNLVDMDSMFEGAISFNQDIGSWNVGSVIAFENLFKNAISFDQNLDSWDVSNIDNMSGMFLGTGLSTSNYDSILIGWSTQALTSNVNFDAGDSYYCEGGNARQNIIDDFEWIINDLGEELNCGQECYDAEKNTLQALSIELGSPTLSNWNFSPEIPLDESWQGIGLTTDGCLVDSLDLNGLGLSGTFEEVGNLLALRYLRMGNNNLTGSIPSSLLNHSNLEYLNLKNNTGLNGTGVPSLLGTISSLEFLDLGGNDLGGAIPPSIGNLTNLKTIDLSGNQLTESIPSWLGSSFNELERLYLYNNHLSGTLPVELGAIPNLLILWLHGNNLEECTPYSYTNHCDADVRMDLNPLLNNEDFYNFCETSNGNCAGSLTLNLDAILQGPYDSSTGLMTDNIRLSNSFPLQEPYQSIENVVIGGREEITDPNILMVDTDDAVVDWIFVELRDGNDPTHVLQTKSALIQKDGDIVSSIDGISGLKFHNPISISSNVVVAIRHRNHFGVRTDLPISLTGAGGVINIDFTSQIFSLFGDPNATENVSGIRVLISGDANGDGSINAIDKNNHWRITNGLPYDYSFSKGDFNLDGVVNAIDKNVSWRLNNGKIELLD